VLILNDLASGYPFACFEGSIISASRTAASAALAAAALAEQRGGRPCRLGVVGTGLIAKYVYRFLAAMAFNFTEVHIYDQSSARAEEFARHLATVGVAGTTSTHQASEGAIRSSDLVLFATTAGTPHVKQPSWFGHHPIVLHLSLRDLAPEVILAGANIVDDVDHCLRADTSLHLTEKLTGNRAHVQATLYDVLTGAWTAPADRTAFFSPFGLGILDLVVAQHVYELALARREITMIDGFFDDNSSR
jgi:ornithine cyclodeaminase